MPRDESSAQRAARLRLGRLPGYVRQPDPARRGGEDGRTYKKGWEVRFTARSEEEITEIRELVTAAGFAPARPFFKGHQLIQPVYGIAAVQAYLAARESVEAAETTARTDRRTAGIPEQIRREPDSVAAAVRAAESAAAEAAAGAAARAGGSAGGAGGGDGGAAGGAAAGAGEAAGRTGSEAAARTAGSAGATVRFGGASATRSARES
ncbi:hypothetical protein [Kitasatospora fiedleri]|uniref:hypothetical protein n=1 Tax=Kitasatospora fiedleri TaxID=2991545 RepID=UPI00249B6DBA|nr:hypothetical protein [Kitasatospora fiedleri]